MKIKLKKTILLAFTLLISASLLAQEEGKEENSKFFISVKAGPRFSLGLKNYEYPIYLLNPRIPNIYLGSGYETELNFGYQLNNLIDFEMGASYFFNNKDVNVFSKNSPYVEITENYSSNVIQLKPSIVFKTQLKKIKAYLKTGGNIGVYKEIKKEVTEERIATIKSLTKTSTKSDLPIGFHLSMGVEYKIKRNIILFTEFSLNVLKIKKIIYNTRLNSIIYSPDPDGFPGSQITYDYSNELFNPREELGSNLTISNYGFDFGIKYNL